MGSSLNHTWGRCALTSLVALLTVACSARYPGQLPPKPLWLQMELGQFNPQERGVIYGRGSALNQVRIDQRRAIAEANAIAQVRELLTQRVISLMKTGDQGRKTKPSEGELKEVTALLKGYPWPQAATVEGRFFDAEANTQFAIASLSLERFEKTLSYDPSDATTKAVTIEYARVAFKSLRP